MKKKQQKQPMEKKKNNFLIMHLLLVFFIMGEIIFIHFNKKNFSDFEKEKSREILKYSIKTTIFIFIFLILFVISPLFFEMGSLYIFTSILFPASIIFYFTIYIVGYTEIKKGRNFIYPFI